MADCTYSVPDLDVSADSLYGARICSQPFIDFAWKTHGFNSTYWQGGWGFDDACNIRKPVARVLNAIWLLTYSAEDYQNDDWAGDILHWGPRYVREQFSFYHDLRAACGTSPIALTTGCQKFRQFDEWKCKEEGQSRRKSCREWSPIFAWVCFLWSIIVETVCIVWGWVTTRFCALWSGTVGDSEHVTLYLAYFYPLNAGGNVDVVARASTLVHEARHIGGHPHDAKFPAGSVYGSGDGADSSWQYEGGWMYHALYLWWFSAAATRTSLAQRQSARQQANVILTNAFATSPGFLVP